MKSISDIFWHLPLNDSSTILFKWMKHLHNEEKKIPKPTPQEKEIERVFNLAKNYTSDVPGLISYIANPNKIGHISNNLNFLIERYNGPKKQEYTQRLILVEQQKKSYNDPLLVSMMYSIFN